MIIYSGKENEHRKGESLYDNRLNEKKPDGMNIS